MAATVVLSTVSLAPGASSAATVFALTPPCTGIAYTLATTSSGTPIYGCVIQMQTSIDGTTWSDPQRLPGETIPNPANSYAAELVGYVDAKNAVSVKFIVHNRSMANPQTVTLTAIQV